MKKSVYIETSIRSCLIAWPSRDIRAATWQPITVQWWDEARAGTHRQCNPETDHSLHLRQPRLFLSGHLHLKFLHSLTRPAA